MDNGFDYPNDLCVQNALWRRLDAIEILQIRLDTCQELPDLSCFELEEAVTRIFAHLAYCVNNLDNNHAVITCTGTDIIILCIYFYCMLPITEL